MRRRLEPLPTVSAVAIDIVVWTGVMSSPALIRASADKTCFDPAFIWGRESEEASGCLVPQPISRVIRAPATRSTDVHSRRDGRMGDGTTTFIMKEIWHALPAITKKCNNS